MSAEPPECGDTNFKDKGYPRHTDDPRSRYGCCGSRMQAIQYKKADGTPGVCLVCPVCDSLSVAATVE